MTSRWCRDRHGRVMPLPDTRLPRARPTQMMTYPFPLNGGVFARFVLPVDLTAREAERLKAHILSLAQDDPA
jgi:hypothetical protein